MNLLAKYRTMLRPSPPLSLVVDKANTEEREKSQKWLIKGTTSNIRKLPPMVEVALTRPEIVEPGAPVCAIWVNPHTQGSPEARCQSLQEVMDVIILNARDRIIKAHRGRQYEATDEIRPAERNIERLQLDVMNGQAKLSEYQAPCERWVSLTIERLKVTS